MNRLFILLAAGLLGTGCVSGHDTCDSHTVWIDWNDFTRATSTGYAPDPSCAGIKEVDVFVDNDPQGFAARCDDRTLPVTLLTGNHTVTVEVIGTDGYPVLRDPDVAFSVSDICGDQALMTYPGEAMVSVNYDFGGGACLDPSYMWFNIHDDIANVDIAGTNGASSNPAFYTCNARSLSAFPLPAGDYTLDFMEEVVYSGGAYHVTGAYCSPTRFSLRSGVDASTPVVHLADTTTACQ